MTTLNSKTDRMRTRHILWCAVVSREYNVFNYKCICVTLITLGVCVCVCAVGNSFLFAFSNYKLKSVCTAEEHLLTILASNSTKRIPRIRQNNTRICSALLEMYSIAYKHHRLNSTQPNPTQSNSTEPIYRICIFNWVGCRSLMNVKCCSRSARILAVAQTWLLSVLRAYDAQLLHRQCCKWFSFNWILFVVAHAVHNAL